jgi:hypothetical protein
MAPIHFPPRPRFLPIPGRLRAHTHAIPILADCTLPLPLLVIFSLIDFLLTCTMFACWIPGSLPLCPFHLTGTHPIISWPHTLLSVHNVVILTASSVGDSVPCYHYPSFGLWLSSPSALTLPLVSDSFPSFHLPFSVLLLTAWSVLGFPMYINPLYYSCIL